MTNNIPDLNFFLQKGIMLDAQQGFADAFNRLLFVLQNIKGDGITIYSSCSADGLITFSALNPSGVVLHPRPFDLDFSDPQVIAVKNAIVTTASMSAGDEYPVFRVFYFPTPATIPCSGVPTPAILWYLMTQRETDLIAGDGGDCMLSVDPDNDDPNHLLFRIPLYKLDISAKTTDEGESAVTTYSYSVACDLRGSTLVRLS